MNAKLSAYAIVVVLASACSTPGSEPPSDARPADGARSPDATLAVPDAAPAPTACRIETVATSAGCNDDCEVRLFLPNGARFCTLTCASDAACTPYGASLTCAAEVGTCMPKCTTDAQCTSQGLARCHPLGSFCDTIPPCQTDAQCAANGLTTCVMPGSYCQ